MKILIALTLVLMGLALLVPHSSTRPDAIQHVLGLAGGVDNAWKALGGIVVAALFAMAISYVLKRTSRPKP